LECATVHDNFLVFNILSGIAPVEKDDANKIWHVAVGDES